MPINYQVIQPQGILDSFNCNNLRHEILDTIERGAKTILLDLHEISFMNSSGMSKLVATLKAVKAAGGELILCSLSNQIRINFEISRMDLIFPIYCDRAEFEAGFIT